MRSRVALFLCCLSFLAPPVADAAIDLKTTNPSKLLDLLINGNYPGASLTIDEPVQHWVEEKDLPKLVLLLDSTVPCASVALSRSSFWPGISTVGDQAAYLIEGFRAGVYPPSLHSGKMAPGLKDEIRAWWAARKH